LEGIVVCSPAEAEVFQNHEETRRNNAVPSAEFQLHGKNGVDPGGADALLGVLEERSIAG
jgi:hypothetical protein